MDSAINSRHLLQEHTVELPEQGGTLLAPNTHALPNGPARIARLAAHILKARQVSLDDSDPAQVLVPLAVIALEGDKQAAALFAESLQSMAVRGWGLENFGTCSGLNDAFCIRALCEIYGALLDRDLISHDEKTVIGAWLYDLALIRVDGRISQMPDFEPWHQLNQSVPASMVYEIAMWLDKCQPDCFDTACLWEWADQHCVGWDVTSRSPDDSWLYHYIWLWSAYRQAVLRKPHLLYSDNARVALQFYKHLSTPSGMELVFGESHPGDRLGPMVGLILGAVLLEDAEQLWVADQLLQKQEADGFTELLLLRGPELYRLWSLWPCHMQPKMPERQSCLLESPQPGKGWSLGGTPYNDIVKCGDKRFPGYGKNTCDNDVLYQVTDPSQYRMMPDKMVFCESGLPQSMFALLDLRAHGLHDHPDALNLVTLITDDIPWLVETAYLPRETQRTRWKHNVPLYRRGHVGPAGLLHWRSDTWREVAPGDACLTSHRSCIVADAWLRHDSFDYVKLDGDIFDVQRRIVFRPDASLIVVDRLTAMCDADVTLGQIWHTTASVTRCGPDVTLRKRNSNLHARFDQNIPMSWHLGHRIPPHRDATYFDNAISDMLWYAQTRVECGQEIIMGACFMTNDRGSGPLELKSAMRLEAYCEYAS